MLFLYFAYLIGNNEFWIWCGNRGTTTKGFAKVFCWINCLWGADFLDLFRLENHGMFHSQLGKITGGYAPCSVPHAWEYICLDSYIACPFKKGIWKDHPVRCFLGWPHVATSIYLFHTMALLFVGMFLRITCPLCLLNSFRWLLLQKYGHPLAKYVFLSYICQKGDSTTHQLRGGE